MTESTETDIAARPGADDTASASQGVAAGLQGLGLGLHGLAVGFEGVEALGVEVDFARFQAFDDGGQVFAQQGDV